MSNNPPVTFLREHPTIKSIFPAVDQGGDQKSVLHYVTVPDVLLTCVSGLGVIPVWEGCILDETLAHHEHLKVAPEVVNRVAREVARTDKYVHIRGEYFSLMGLWTGGFYHWMLESTLQVIAALEAGFKGIFIVPARGFAWETMLMLGVPPERMIVKDDRPWHLESLLMFRPISAPDGLRQYPTLLARVRERLLQAIGGERGQVNRIYVQRRPEAVQSRRVVNEGQLIKVLEPYGFQCVALEKLPLREQIRIAAGATCMVGPHGAGMVHCLFMPPESLVMELFSPTYINPCMLPLMEHLRHRYYMVPSTKIKEYGFGEDIEANLSMIQLTLQHELGMGRSGG